MENSVKSVRVAVGVIYDANRQVFFVCRRKSHQHQGGKWEFPGGKIDDNETVTQALQRELKEEIDIDVDTSSELTTIHFDYPDKKVSLFVHLVCDFSGQPRGAEGQESCWVDLQALSTLSFPDANKAIISLLQDKFLQG